MLSMSEIEEFIVLGKDTGREVTLNMKYFDKDGKVAIKTIKLTARPVTVTETIGIMNKSFDAISDEKYRNIVRNRHSSMLMGEDDSELFSDIPIDIISQFNFAYNVNYLKASVKDYIEDYDERVFDEFLSKIDTDSITQAVVEITQASGDSPDSANDVDNFHQDTERKTTRSSARV